jgi:hypothetical protein
MGRAGFIGLSIIVLWFIPVDIFPHDLTLMGGLTNFTSNEAIKTPPPVIADRQFKMLGSAGLSGDFSTNISYRLELGLDPLGCYYLMGETAFRFGILKVGAGSLFSYSTLGVDLLSNPALIANVGLEIPGALFAEGKVVRTFSDGPAEIGETGYDYLGVSVGYWTQDIIAGFYYDSKKLARKRSASLVSLDSLVRYFIHAGIYDKNRLWTINLDMGFEVLRSEMGKAAQDATQVEALFAGLEVIARVSNRLSLHIKGEVPHAFVYPSDFFWWSLATGLTIRLAD